MKNKIEKKQQDVFCKSLLKSYNKILVLKMIRLYKFNESSLN